MITKIEEVIVRLAQPKPYKVLKINRLIILMSNPQCELCGAEGKHVHHKNKNKADHNLSNLMVVCPMCHTSLHNKYSRVKEKAERYNLSYSATMARLHKGVPLTFPKNMWSTKYTFKKQDYRRWTG